MIRRLADRREMRRLSQVSRLVIVAHPDDETFWAGLTLSSNQGWGVACLTHRSTRWRRERYKAATTALNCPSALLDLPDRHWDALDSADLLRLTKAIKELVARPGITDVMTHSPDGETGHTFHKIVSRVVSESIPTGVALHFFNFDPEFRGPRDAPEAWTRKAAALRAYYPTTEDMTGNDGLHIRLSEHESPVRAGHYVRQASLLRTIYAGSSVPNATITDR